MTLHAIGSIIMSNVICQKCSCKIFVTKSSSSSITCKECGAFYKAINYDTNVDELKIELTYEFRGFKCLDFTYGTGSCDSMCPAPYMYCKEHTNDEWFDRVQRCVVSAESTLKTYQDRLDRMKESKKVWLIQEVSGIDE